MHVRSDSDNEYRFLAFHALISSRLTDWIETAWISRPKAASQRLLGNRLAARYINVSLLRKVFPRRNAIPGVRKYPGVVVQ